MVVRTCVRNMLRVGVCVCLCINFGPLWSHTEQQPKIILQMNDMFAMEYKHFPH